MSFKIIKHRNIDFKFMQSRIKTENVTYTDYLINQQNKGTYLNNFGLLNYLIYVHLHRNHNFHFLEILCPRNDIKIIQKIREKK